MKFVRIIKDCKYLCSSEDPEKEFDELTSSFEKWDNTDYLLDFFKDSIKI